MGVAFLNSVPRNLAEALGQGVHFCSRYVSTRPKADLRDGVRLTESIAAMPPRNTNRVSGFAFYWALCIARNAAKHPLYPMLVYAQRSAKPAGSQVFCR